MKLVDALKEYLRRVERGAHTEPKRGRDIDRAVARRHFFDQLEALESRPTGAATQKSIGAIRRPSGELREPEGPARVLQNTYESGALDVTLSTIVSELERGLCAGALLEELQRHVHHVLDLLVRRSTRGVSKVQERELIRIAKAVEAQMRDHSLAFDVPRYTSELRLVRGTDPVLTPIGRVLLTMPEPDAVHWLLLLETKQSMGARDRWRMSNMFLGIVIGNHPDPLPQDDLEDFWRFDLSGLERLVAFEAVERYFTRADDALLRLNPQCVSMLRAVADEQRTPLAVLAETLISGERNTLAQHALALPDASHSAAEAQARHARMVAHEIRNALGPVQLALPMLFDELRKDGESEDVARRRERVEKGIVRVFDFLEKMQDTAELGVTSLVPFHVEPAIRDAVVGMNGGFPMEVRYAIEPSLPAVLGHRDRFSLAVVNLVRNAVQNSIKPRSVILITASRSIDARGVTVMVEDDGPGVPDKAVEDVFRRGFALRAGGSGQGLALVKEIVELEMRGAVHYERSSLGGARFVLVLPVHAMESP